MEVEQSLIEKAKQIGGKIVLPEGKDERVLKAARKITDLGLADVVVLPRDDARYTAGKHSISLEGIELIEPSCSTNAKEFAEEYFRLRQHKGITLQEAEESMKDPLYFGAMMVHKGLVSSMVAGAANTTSDVLRPALRIVGTADNIPVVSSTFFMILDEFRGEKDKVFFFSDCAVVPDPTPEQLAAIGYSTAQTARRVFGIKDPKVAFLSFSSKGSAKHPLVEKVQKAVECAHCNYPDLTCDGELQLDAAIIPEVAQKKVPDSEVAGNAQVLIFPDLNAGNIGYKLVERLAGARAIGPIIQGLAKPVNDLSRGCSVEDIVLVSAVTLLMLAQK